METNPTTPVATAERDLVITRIFNAPRELVWKAWTDPEHMKKWWGPKDFTCPTVEIDFHVGGKFLLCMRAADEQEIWVTGTYKEIVPMERFVVTDSFADKNGNIVPSIHYGMEGIPLELLITVELEDAGNGKTKMTLRHRGFPAGEHIEGANVGWNESFDKLEASLH